MSTFFRLTTAFTVLVASRGALILADALLIVLSWWKLSYHASGLGKVILGRSRLTIPSIMLRDGEHIQSLAFRALLSDAHSEAIGTIYFV